MSVLYVYEAIASSGETLLANSSSSPFGDLFDAAKNRLAQLKSLRYEEETCLFLPSSEEEDANQSRRRQAFRLGEWILPAMVVNLDGEPVSYLLVDRSLHSHAYVLNAKTLMIEVICLRGFQVCEDEEPLGIELFLDSLQTEEELSAPVSFQPVRKAPVVEFSFTDTEEEEEIFDIEVIRPTFTATSKKTIKNLGSGLRPLEEDEDEEDDIEIEVAKPAFTANKKGKVPNLDVRRAPKKKPIVIEPKKEQEEEPYKPVVLERSAFVPASNKKPRQIRDERPSKKPQKPIQKPAEPAVLKQKPEEIKPIEPKPIEPVKAAEAPATVEAVKTEVKVIRAVEKEEKAVDPRANWVAVNEFVYSPASSARGSIILIDDPNDAPVHEHIRKVAKNLSDFGNPHWSSRCAFCPDILPQDDPHMQELSSFKEDDWVIWAVNEYLGQDPISYLCCNKANPRFFIVISIVSGNLVISGISTDGASIGFPPKSFLELRGIVRGHAKKIVATPREDRLLTKAKKAIAEMERNLNVASENPMKLPPRLKKEMLLVRNEIGKAKKHLAYSSSPEKTEEIVKEHDLFALPDWVNQICFEIEQTKTLREGSEA